MSTLPAWRVALISTWRLRKIIATIAVELEPLGFKPLDILNFLVDFSLSLLNLTEVELLQVGSFAHFKLFLNYTQATY